MASLLQLQTTASSCYSLRAVKSSLHVPKPPRVPFSVPKVPTTKLHIEEGFNGSINTSTTPFPLQNIKMSLPQIYDGLYKSKVTNKLYAVLEAIADRIEMHNNVRQQRDNWNSLLLNSINMITLSATAMSGIAAATSTGDTAPLLALKLSSTLLFSAATGMLLIMNKIQPSQLAEEQRIATRSWHLTKLIHFPCWELCLTSFLKFEPAVWWPNTQFQRKSDSKTERNGWSEELEMELREVIEVVKRKDIEDYERLGNIALKINKSLAIAGPLLTGIAAVGSAFVGNGSLAAIVPLMAGSLAAAVNAFEHGGQVGMVFEMYRNCGGFFKLLEETVETTLEEKDVERRENGEIMEMKMALKLGRSVSQLRELASKSASCRMEGIAVDEFASKLF
ncbi:Petal formation-expressed [Sesbania bispinosa]|nr:Petal formation-expressed [Sesbania bispinosa]